jgi:hypothetical protein
MCERVCHHRRMCVQCAMGAMTAGAAATGARSWLATRRWVSPTALRHLTKALLAGALVASALLVSA